MGWAVMYKYHFYLFQFVVETSVDKCVYILLLYPMLNISINSAINKFTVHNHMNERILSILVPYFNP
jgi:hypothetical protein